MVSASLSSPVLTKPKAGELIEAVVVVVPSTFALPVTVNVALAPAAREPMFQVSALALMLTSLLGLASRLEKLLVESPSSINTMPLIEPEQDLLSTLIV
jgi:hypothetical protein